MIIMIWLFCCFYYRNRFFYLLVIFEGITLAIFLLLSYYISYYEGSFDSIILFLSIIVAEGGFGLGLLIFMIRRVGDDKSLRSLLSSY